MRFRLGLPMLQVTAMLVILWAPWVPGAHKFDIVLRDGREFKGWTLLPDPLFDAPAWAQAVNLPAIPTEIPMDLIVDRVKKEAQLPDPRMRFFVFWSVGLLVWYLVGRLVEDVVQWRRDRVLPRARLADLVFAFEAALVATLAVLVSLFGSRFDSPVFPWSSAIWFVIASAALTVRLLQFVRYKRRRAVP